MLGRLPFAYKVLKILPHPQSGIRVCRPTEFLPRFWTKVLCKQPENIAIPTIMALLGHTLMPKLHEMLDLFSVKVLATLQLCCSCRRNTGFSKNARRPSMAQPYALWIFQHSGRLLATLLLPKLFTSSSRG